MWCVARDFNSIRFAGKRRGQNSNVSYNSEIQSFNNLIEDSCKNFTWHKSNGTFKSRIDRILVSHEWLKKWPKSK